MATMILVKQVTDMIEYTSPVPDCDDRRRGSCCLSVFMNSLLWIEYNSIVVSYRSPDDRRRGIGGRAARPKPSTYKSELTNVSWMCEV